MINGQSKKRKKWILNYLVLHKGEGAKNQYGGRDDKGLEVVWENVLETNKIRKIKKAEN
jgi:hypothetical protein